MLRPRAALNLFSSVRREQCAEGLAEVYNLAADMGGMGFTDREHGLEYLVLHRVPAAALPQRSST